MSGAGGDQLHVMVADVVKSFDTRAVVDSALGRLGLPPWFRKVYLSCHNQVRLGFKLAAGFGEPWCRDGGIPQEDPLSMVFIVALCVSPGAGGLSLCPPSSRSCILITYSVVLFAPVPCFGAAWFTVQYVRSNIFRALFLRPGTSKLVFGWRVGRVFGVLRRTLEGGSFGEG